MTSGCFLHISHPMWEKKNPLLALCGSALVSLYLWCTLWSRHHSIMWFYNKEINVEFVCDLITFQFFIEETTNFIFIAIVKSHPDKQVPWLCLENFLKIGYFNHMVTKVEKRFVGQLACQSKWPPRKMKLHDHMYLIYHLWIIKQFQSLFHRPLQQYQKYFKLIPKVFLFHTVLWHDEATVISTSSLGT